MESIDQNNSSSSSPIGMATGSLLFTGEQKMDTPQIDLTAYKSQQHKTSSYDSIEKT